MQRVELLAPAGTEAALHAAVRAGADAVYLGLGEFNARRGADNFTEQSLGAACAYAHLRGVRVYLTLNTAVLPDELSSALRMARSAYEAGVDAFIVQDLGVALQLARLCPDARLHISTQMNVHNADGVRAAAALGAARVTLARELSLPEIGALCAVAAEEGVEVEAFAHGALCVCYSGQCLMSSLIGGRSANRGMCAQACRLPYELGQRWHDDEGKPLGELQLLDSPGEHLLSPQDLCSIDVLPQLVAAGVASLKIEGRMKSPEYVFAVTAAYRAALDRVQGGGAYAVTDAEHQALKEAFSRGFTTAYLEGERGNAMMSYQRPNNRGALVGRVARMERGVALIDVQRRLVPGDVLEFWTSKGHVAQAVCAEVQTDARGWVRVPLDAKVRGVHEGDRVFRVRSAEAAFADDALQPRIPLQVQATLRIGEPLELRFRLAEEAQAESRSEAVVRRLRAWAAAAGVPAAMPEGVACGDAVQPARTKAVDAQSVVAHIDRMGTTPFCLVDSMVNLDEGAGVGFSEVHHVRARALDNLRENILAPYGQRTAAAKTLFAPRDLERAAVPAPCVTAWATNPACARAARRAGAELVYVPALNYKRGSALRAGCIDDAVDQAGYPKQCVLALPAVSHDAVGAARERACDLDAWQCAEGARLVYADSLGGMQRCAEEGRAFEVGFHVPLTNSLSLDAAARMGAARAWLSPELTLTQIRTLGKTAALPLGLFVHGAAELMVCEHCLLMSQGPCAERCASCERRRRPHFLRDRKGFEFPVATDALGRGHIYNAVPLDAVPLLPELIAAGVSAFMVDTTLMVPEQAAQAVGRVRTAIERALRSGEAVAPLPNTTKGHLFRGVS